MNKTELLNRFSADAEERVVLARVLDRMERTLTEDPAPGAKEERP